MKNMHLSVTENNQISIWFMTLIFLLSSCQKKINENTDYDEIVKKTEINPEFEQFPPIAENIEMEVLQKPLNTGENIRVVAEFKNEKLKNGFLALNVGSTKIALRDDGKGADLKAQDGKFSIFLKDDIDSLAQELSERRRMILSKQAPSFTFENRMAVPIDLQTVKKFDVDLLKKDRIFEIPRDILFPNLPIMIRHEKSLTITAPGVINDPERTFDPCSETGNPNGVWTFGSLMRQMASLNPSSIATDAQVSSFVMDWLKTWGQNITVNDQIVGSRSFVEEYILDPWLHRSQIAGAPRGQLKMEFAPFKLTAIVNRLDLRGNSGYGFSNAGEGRFIFSVIFSDPCYSELGPAGPAIPSEGVFNVILEYGINKKGCQAIIDYGQEWANLSTMIPGTLAYSGALENITNQFTLCGSNPSMPNQSSINQVRTNEFLGTEQPWELREFHLSGTGKLITVPVQMEPSSRYNNQSSTTANSDEVRFANYVNSRSTEIANNNYVLPEKIPAIPGTTTPVIPFLAGLSPMQDDGGVATSYWDGTSTPGPGFIVNDDARHIFSLNTCSACHSRETNTDFQQIGSGFLTGITVTDAANRPAGSPAIRIFNDLARREMDLANLINLPCLGAGLLGLAKTLSHRPINMVH